MANTLEKAIRTVLTEAGPDSIPGRVEPTPEFDEVGGSTHDNVAPRLDYAKPIKPGQGRLPNAGGGGPEKNPTKYKKREDLDPKKDMSEEDDIGDDSLEEDSERLPAWLKTMVSENLEEEEDYLEEADDEDEKDDDEDEDDEKDDDEDEKDDDDVKEDVELEINEEYFDERRSEAFAFAEESLLSIFGNNKLSESFKNKLIAVFESAVQSQIDVIAEEMEARYELALNEQISGISDALVEKVDAYLNYVSEEWLNENEIAIERSMKAELTEDFMVGLKQLFEEHYIEVPEKKLDVLNALAEQNEQLSVQLNSTLNENIELIETLKEYKKDELISEASEGLIDSKASKLRKLAESISFDDNFEDRLISLRETVDGNRSSTKKTTLTEDAERGKDLSDRGDRKTNPDPLIEQTLKVLDRSQNKK